MANLTPSGTVSTSQIEEEEKSLGTPTNSFTRLTNHSQISDYAILLVLKLIWKPLFASTVNYELAEAEGLNPDRAKAIFTILMAAIIAISIKMVGLLLITGMLIIPAAMARNISDNPKKMIIFSQFIQRIFLSKTKKKLNNFLLKIYFQQSQKI